MNYAVNVIGKYVLPPDWVNNPAQVTCSFHDDQARTEEVADELCDEQFCHNPSCSAGSNGDYDYQ